MLTLFCRQLALLFACTFVLLSSACAELTAVDGVAHTLDITAIAVNTSWSLAVEVRDLEQREVVAEARARAIEIDEAEARIRDIRAAWEPRFAAFRAVRHAHEVAVTLLESVRTGATPLSALLAKLDHILALYRELKTLLPVSVQEEIP